MTTAPPIEESRPRWVGWLGLVPALLLVCVGLYALDFGPHWDEDNAWIRPLAVAFERGAPLPGKYNYPTFGFWLTFFATAPEVIGAKLSGVDVSEHVIAAIDGQPFRLRLRAIFLVLSSLAVVWTYRLVWTWRGRAAEALLAASLLAFSFEVSYHVRWVAPDGLLMQFGALTALACVSAVRAQDGRRWLWAAAVAAALGCGSKYPGGLLLVPVAVAYVAVAVRRLRFGAARVVRTLLLGAGLVTVFALVFLATTPGALLEPEAFRRDLDYEFVHYREAGHGVYTTEAGLAHLGRVLEYFGSQLLSPFDALAWALFVLAGIGALFTAWRSPLVFAVLACFPVLYVGYMSTTVVLAVRNVLVVAPFLAVFTARGAAALLAFVRPRSAQRAVAALVAVVPLVHLGYAADAAERTRHRSIERSARAFAREVRASESALYGLSPRVRAALDTIDAGEALAGRVTDLDDPASTHVAILPLECGHAYSTWRLGPEDIRWHGPREINLLYYPSAWNVDQRILVMPVATARSLGVVE